MPFCVNVRAKIHGDKDYLEAFDFNKEWEVYDFSVTDAEANEAVLRADTLVQVDAESKEKAIEIAMATYPPLGIKEPLAPCNVEIWVDSDIDVTEKNLV